MLLVKRADTVATSVLPGATGYATPVVDEKTGKEIYDPMNRYKVSPHAHGLRWHESEQWAERLSCGQASKWGMHIWSSYLLVMGTSLSTAAGMLGAF